MQWTDVVKKLTQNACTNWTKWLQKWLFVLSVFRYDQSGNVIKFFVLLAALLFCAILANYGAVPYSLISYIKQLC